MTRARFNYVMKKVLLLAVLYLIGASAILPIAVAGNSPVVGHTCSHLRQVVVSQGESFTCIKSGKKLIWSKPVKMAIQSKSVVTRTSPLKGYFPIASANFNSMRDDLASRTPSGLTLDIHISPRLNHKYIDVSLIGLKRAMEYWSDLYKPEYAIPVFFVDPRDKPWFDSEFPKVVGDKDELRAFDEERSTHLKDYGSGEAGTDPVSGKNFIVFIYTKDFRANFGTSQIGGHEYTHDVQHSFSIWNYPTQFPCWAKEGEAEFFGMSLAQTTLSDYLNVRLKFFQNNEESDTNLPQVKIDWVQFFTQAEENKFNCAAGGVYEAGALAFEYLYSLHGREGILNLWKNLETSPTFDDALFQTFTQHKEQLYKNFGDYIQSQLVEFRKN